MAMLRARPCSKVERKGQDLGGVSATCATEPSEPEGLWLTSACSVLTSKQDVSDVQRATASFV